MWPRARVLEALNLGFGTLMILGLDSCKPKVVTAPALPSSQDEDLCAGKEPDGIDGKNSTPCRV